MSFRTTLAPLAALGLTLGGCMTAPDDGTAPPSMEGPCDAAAGQSLVGQKATAENGQRALALTDARVLRWGPPDSAFTMDYRPDRVNVIYDRDMTITQVTCG